MPRSFDGFAFLNMIEKQGLSGPYNPQTQYKRFLHPWRIHIEAQLLRI